MRAFIAVELPEQTKETLSKIQAELSLALPPIKWVTPENLHLTMIFLGNIDEANINVICPAIEECTIKTKGIKTRLAGLGCFPNKKNPRVIFAQLENEEEFVRLHHILCTELRIIPEKYFKAHITLCRFKEGEKLSLTHKLPDLTESAAFTINRLTLFKSTLHANGPFYEKIFSAEII